MFSHKGFMHLPPAVHAKPALSFSRWWNFFISSCAHFLLLRKGLHRLLLTRHSAHCTKSWKGLRLGQAFPPFHSPKTRGLPGQPAVVCGVWFIDSLSNGVVCWRCHCWGDVLNVTTFCKLCFITEKMQQKKLSLPLFYTLWWGALCWQLCTFFATGWRPVHYFNKVNKNAQRLTMLLCEGAVFFVQGLIVWHFLMKVIIIEGSVFCFAAVGRL